MCSHSPNTLFTKKYVEVNCCKNIKQDPCCVADQKTTRNTKIILLKINFHQMTAADNFASLAILAAAFVCYFFTESWRPPPPHDASTYIAAALVASARTEMSASEVTTPHHVINITGDTKEIENIHIEENTRKNYMHSLVTFIFGVFESHPYFIVHQEALQHSHETDMESLHENDKKRKTQLRKKCEDFF